MKRTKENAIKVLEAMRIHSKKMSGLWLESGESEFSARSSGQATGLQEAIWVLTEPDYFDEMARLFNVTEE